MLRPPFGNIVHPLNSHDININGSITKSIDSFINTSKKYNGTGNSAKKNSTNINKPAKKIGTFGKTPDSFISRALFEDFKARFSYPKKGDVLLSAAGTIGRRVVFNGEDAYFQDSNIVWIDNDERIVTNQFLNVLYAKMDWQTENGGTVSRLYNDNIRNTKIATPSLDEQKRIVAILDSIDGTVRGLKSQLAKARDIKQGMMSYFFG